MSFVERRTGVAIAVQFIPSFDLNISFPVPPAIKCDPHHSTAKPSIVKYNVPNPVNVSPWSFE